MSALPIKFLSIILQKDIKIFNLNENYIQKSHITNTKLTLRPLDMSHHLIK